MFDMFLKALGFRMWNGCICKGYAEFQIFLIVAPYASIMPQWAFMSLNMPEHGSKLLNVPEYA